MRSSNTASGHSADRRTAALRQMTADQLLDLGSARSSIYERARMMAKGSVLYGADGVPLARVDDVETAFEVAAEHDPEFVAVH